MCYLRNMLTMIGVDPGAGGALALVAGPGKLLEVRDMPTYTAPGSTKRRIDADALTAIVRNWKAEHGVRQATVELVGPMPRDGSAGSFWFGKAAGLVEGVLAGLGCEVAHVAPSVWKRRMGLPSASKDVAREEATRRFGGHLWPLKKHDGRAEAALIGLWGWMDTTCGRW